MCASVYYLDVAQEFIPHYIELMNDDPKKTEPMYDTNAKLIFDKELFVGHEAVCEKIQSIGKLDKQRFCGQPYGEKGDILVFAELKSNQQEYVTTFVLHEIDTQKHRFAIILQIVHSS